MILFLRSALFAIVFYGATFFWVLAALAATPFGFRPLYGVVRSWAFFHRRCARIFLGQTIRIEGTFPKGGALLILKHESMFETIDIVCLLDRPVIAAKTELLNIPLWGRVARTYGLIGVEREAGPRAIRALRAGAAKAIAQGRPLCLFPEGTRVPHGERPPIRAGFAAIYGLLDLPVVPVALDSGRLSPRGSFIKRPGVITYKVGEMVPPGLPRREAEARVHSAINALNPPLPGDAPPAQHANPDARGPLA